MSNLFGKNANLITEFVAKLKNLSDENIKLFTIGAFLLENPGDEKLSLQLYGQIDFSKLSHDNLLSLTKENIVMHHFSVEIINALALAL
jgi:hypothetical protein